MTAEKKPSIRRGEMAFIFAVIIGLLLGILIKKVKLGIIIGLILGGTIVLLGWLRSSRR